MLCVFRRSQWSGAKALVNLIKPRKDSSRDRGGDRDKEGAKEKDRAKSAPDIPLPAPPPLLPPETPPPLPKRVGSDSQEIGHAHSNLNNQTSSPGLGSQSPAQLTPIRGKCDVPASQKQSEQTYPSKKYHHPSHLMGNFIIRSLTILTYTCSHSE